MADSPASPAAHPRGRKSRILAALLYAAIVPAAACSLLGFLGKLHWILDLLSHFRVQYLLYLSVGAVVAIVLRQRNPAILATVFALANAAAVSHYLPARSPSRPGDRDLRVIAFNILEDNPDRKAVAAWLAENEADLLILPEFSPRWRQDLEPLNEVYPHRYLQPGYANFGLAILSKWPLSEKKRHTFCASRIPCLSARVDYRGTGIQVVAVHAMSPVSEEHAALRNEHLGNLATYLDSLAGPVIVAGDYNATVFSPQFQSTMGRTSLEDAGRGYGHNPTYHSVHPFFGLQIDHVLHSPDLEAVGFDVGPATSSDHRPVVADLKLEKH